jgi:serine phosphatase RsbU (regulator of sigma subunit)
MGAQGDRENRPLIDWGVATQALQGETRSGDLHVVESFFGGVLVAALDGLGHGEEAEAASTAAAAILSSHAREPVTTLVERCHEALRSTRGVAMSLASFVASRHTMTWLGVGNVEASLFRSDTSAGRRESLPLRGGVVGFRLPALVASTVSVGPGDTLILATDGVSGDFATGLRLFEPPERIAESILARFAHGRDDALALVARYWGEAA